MFGKKVEIEYPEKVKETIREMIEDLSIRYNSGILLKNGWSRGANVIDNQLFIKQF